MGVMIGSKSWKGKPRICKQYNLLPQCTGNLAHNYILSSIDIMSVPFDIIFVDLEFSAYRPIVDQILRKKLLTQDGVILIDNGTSTRVYDCILYAASAC